MLMDDLFYNSYTEGILDPKARQFLTAIAAAGLPALAELTPEDARERNIVKSFAIAPAKVASRQEFIIPGIHRNIPACLYLPDGKVPFATLIYLHGGGWVVGTTDDFDSLCTVFCHDAQIAVVSVDYALAPECRFPEALEECFEVLCWLANQTSFGQLDPERIMVGGDSAGANLAAALTLLTRERKGPEILKQMLICPALNLTAFDTLSYRQFGSGLWVSVETMKWYISHYLRHPSDAFQPYASPLLASGFHQLPPALILTAEFDVLRDEGEEYASKLMKAGIQVTHKRYPGQIHDFLILGKIMPMALSAIFDCCIWLKNNA